MGKSPPSAKSRADRFLFEHGHAVLRTRARAAIEAGKARADGVLVGKPAQLLHEGSRIELAPAHPYVSRSALKLTAALDLFRLSPRNGVCLDLGASTGGVTQVLLERGAARVARWLARHGRPVEGTMESPSVRGSGNREYLVAARRA